MFDTKTNSASQTGTSGPQESYLTRLEVANILKVCPHTVGRLTRRGELPAVVINRRLIRYRRSDVAKLGV